MTTDTMDVPQEHHDLLTRIKKAFSIKTSEATTMTLVSIPHRQHLGNSVYVDWSKENHARLARHLWAISLGYAEIGDHSRARVFANASRSLFRALDDEETLSFKSVIDLPYIGDRVRLEFVHYWACSFEKCLTPRAKELSMKTTKTRYPTPYWSR